MKKMTKKLSTKYVKLNKSRLRQDGDLKSEEEGGELFQENYSPKVEESNETKETPIVTKIVKSMHRKLTLKEKPNKKNIQVDGHDDQLEVPVRNMNRGDMDQLVGSVRHGHMDHLEDLIKGRDRTDHVEGSTRNGARDRVVDQLEGSSKNGQKYQLEDVTSKPSCYVDQSEGLVESPCEFASKKDYLDWIEYVEGSSHHCFVRSENPERPYRKDDMNHDQTSAGASEGSIEGRNDEIMLLKSSKYTKNEKFEDLKRYKKGKGSKVKDSLKRQMV
ncbi:hypothetical protein HA466_0149780 [Hirschfeldia incana]|nr:hypothetical protein HA466_0149780 [Hirschfeldia incana]